MKQELQENTTKLTDYAKKQIFLWLLFFFMVLFISIVIKYEVSFENQLKKENQDKYKSVNTLREEITACNQKITELTKAYVSEIGAKPCVVLCFEQFGKSAYNEIISEMNNYGYTGVIVFRDGKVPGDKGSISIELYQQLLEQGWEGAIGNSEDIWIYHNMPEQIKQKWLSYINEMQQKFIQSGLPAPSVYIPNNHDDVGVEMEEYIEQLGMTAGITTASSKDTVFDISTQMNTDSYTEIGAVVARYSYESVDEDLQTLMPEARSVAFEFQKVENGAPVNKRNTSIYMFKYNLKKLYTLGDTVNVTTFSGFKEYQLALVEKNLDVYTNFQNKKNQILEQIQNLRNEIKDNYR